MAWCEKVQRISDWHAKRARAARELESVRSTYVYIPPTLGIVDGGVASESWQLSQPQCCLLVAIASLED